MLHKVYESPGFMKNMALKMIAHAFDDNAKKSNTPPGALKEFADYYFLCFKRYSWIDY